MIDLTSFFIFLPFSMIIHQFIDNFNSCKCIQIKYQSLLIKSYMNKSKASTSQSKVKPKLPILSPTNNKSLTKNKQKYERVSPRSNRIHTLEAKKTIEIPRKTKMVLELDQVLLEKPTNHNDPSKGYETPKFKCEAQAAQSAKKVHVSHNFFSFGEKEFEKDPVRKKVEKPRERESIPVRNKDSKQVKQYRKEHLIR